MDLLTEKFAKLGVDSAPGQESHQDISIEKCVDFSHGDVNAFEPIPESLSVFIEGFELGSEQAYTPYKGRDAILKNVAKKLSLFTGTIISHKNQLIITPGTQGALFLAMGSLLSSGDKITIIEPDYFANRKIANFFDADIISIKLDYLENDSKAGLDLTQLEDAFKNGAKVFLFSNPNNPTGVIYSPSEINSISLLAAKYDVTVIVDQLYSRQIFDDRIYTHLCAEDILPDNLITIIGPSKTESLSGFRLGVAFGSPAIIKRMEKLQAIVSLRASGYSQAVLKLWFNEPKGWLEDRIAKHQQIRDDLVKLINSVDGVKARVPEAGSYLFIKIPNLKITTNEFIENLRIKENVILTPGTEFGPSLTNSFRINFSQDREKAIDAIKRTIKLIEKHRK